MEEPSQMIRDAQDGAKPEVEDRMSSLAFGNSTRTAPTVPRHHSESAFSG